MRGPALALGMDWLVRLPEGTDKQREVKRQAIEGLADVTELACSVFELAD